MPAPFLARLAARAAGVAGGGSSGRGATLTAQLGVEIEVFGARDVRRAFDRLETKVQKKIIRRVFRKHARVVRQRMVNHLSGNPVGTETGALRAAIASAPIRAASRRPRKLIRIGVVLPDRAELGIDPDDPYYYPTAVEYGHGTVPPHPFMRPAIDNYRRLDVFRLQRELKRQLKAEGFT